MSVLRVNYDDLNDWGDGVWYLRGQLFTGIAFELYENGQLRSEGEYENGQAAGAYREWYPSRRLRSEEYLVEDQNWEREWFENGQLKHERFSDKYGSCTTEQKWNEQGELIYEYKRPSPDQQS